LKNDFLEERVWVVQRVLYISNSEQEYYQEILDGVKNYKGIVTISDIEGFARYGGMIEFVIQKKAHLLINLKNCR